TGNYMNSILIRQEAAIDGYAEGIALDVNGYVSEGSGENIFLVRDGRIFTPPLGASILAGITRSSLIRIARDLGLEVVEALVRRQRGSRRSRCVRLLALPSGSFALLGGIRCLKAADEGR